MNAICSNMDGPKDYHTKWSQKEGQIPYDITYMWNLKYNTNEHISKKKSLTNAENSLGAAKGRGGGGGKIESLGLKGAN